MKKLILSGITMMAVLIMAPSAHAQMMGTQSAASSEIQEHTKAEEAEGRAIWEKLQAKEVLCENISEGEFEALGEYFMGQMMGDSHAAMNEMIMRTHGEEGEEQIHAVMGKRLSGCDTSAAFPAGGVGWMMPMQMMWGGWDENGSGSFPMGGWGGVHAFAVITWLVWFVVIVLAAVWILKQIRKK